MRVLFHAPPGCEAEIVNMDGDVHIRIKTTRDVSYILSAHEAMQMAQILEENALQAQQSLTAEVTCTCRRREGLHSPDCPLSDRLP